MIEAEGRQRVRVENVRPQVDCGRYPVKRVEGESIVVRATIYADGHDSLAAVLRFRPRGQKAFAEVPMRPLGNDLWEAAFTVESLGFWEYQVVSWVDRFLTWSRDLDKRVSAGQDVKVDLAMGAELVVEARGAAASDEATALGRTARILLEAGPEAVRAADDPALADLMSRFLPRRFATEGPLLTAEVERERARFSAWYELFPRSLGEDGKHGTLADVARALPRVASMGFDVLYLPPIHPIGRAHRKGKNNETVARPEDPGSPWAIGGREGGHTAVHPELGTIEDFRRLVTQAREHGLDVALDIAFQCSPDHPWVREHPEWFRHRADGTIQYAENPPKKYQDIYPFDFETEAWRPLWEALLSVFTFWIDKGVTIFRVDNPHTKSLAFWEWCLAEVKNREPSAIFLSEAFTRPHLMYGLAKLGFSQSYTYFTWRTTAAELRAYMTELTRTEVSEYFRPNLWPNTPDILPEQLQVGGAASFRSRLVLAATLGANYGVYGPAFELLEHEPLAPGKEEYLHSEKYEIRRWNLGREDSLESLMRQLNQVRRENPPLMRNDTLVFHETDSESLLCYSKTAPGSSPMLVVVNLDPDHRHAGHVTLDLEALGIDPQTAFQAHDLLADDRYLWRGSRAYVELEPGGAHLMALRRKVRTEKDFEYFL